MAETPERSGPTLLTTASTSVTVHTASGGAGTWDIVRSILVANLTSAEVKVTIGVGTSNTDTTAKRIASAVPILAGETADIPLTEKATFLVLKGHATTPDLIYAFCNTTNGATVTTSLVRGP